MDRVLKEHSKIPQDMSGQSVHDLRVALRRCLSISNVMRGLDPSSEWDKMRKASRSLFRKLGEVRDTQVLIELVKRLGADDPQSTSALVRKLASKYETERADAWQGVKDFNRKKWREWRNALYETFARVVSNPLVCESLALDQWEAVQKQYRRTQKSKTPVAYHRQRIEIKKFRYVVESFLPSLYARWEDDLKLLQDVLGEVHDLDVLAGSIASDPRPLSKEVQAAWTQKLQAERTSRLHMYQTKMAGKASVPRTWREGLPAGRESRAAGLARLAEWASFVSPNFARVRRAARFSSQIYDGLENGGLIGSEQPFDERSILHVAALLHQVGRSKDRRAYHKESFKMIRKVTPPTGWSPKELEVAAVIARFHRGALPRSNHKALRTYSPPLRDAIVLLASILRLGVAFNAKPYRSVRRLEVEKCSGVLVVRCKGNIEKIPLAGKFSIARRLLEVACGIPVHISASGRPFARLAQPQLAAAQSDAA